MKKVRIDRKASFRKINIAILVISDTRDSKSDKSGKLLTRLINKSGHKVADNKIVKDTKKDIRKEIKQWLVNKNIQAIISTGGTGITARDVTPEVFREFFEKEIEGSVKFLGWLVSRKLEHQQYSHDQLQEYQKVHFYSHCLDHQAPAKMRGMKF